MAKESLKSVAYNYLYENIVYCNLKPGSAIVEQEISDRINISRTPIREALKQLVAEGLVYHIPGRGTFVQNVSTQDIEEIFELRELFEKLSLKHAIESITVSEIEDIEQKLLSLNENSKPEDFYNADRDLHLLILKYSRNRRMVAFLNTINSQLERLRRLSAMAPKRLEKSKQEHLEILYAIKERDLAKASRALKSHLDNIKVNIIEICRNSHTSLY